MNRNQLKYFVAAAEARSFTKAAEQYYISQTAVTQQIHLLEETLGCALFDRGTRPVSLTPAGKSFLLDAKAILERMSRAAERVHDASTGLTGTLRVGYVRGYERSDLSVLMRRFHQQNGNVLITFYRCSSDTLAAGLLHQKYDIIFTWDSTNLRTQKGVTCRTVEKAGLVVALYAGHPLAQRRQLRRRELRGESILYMSPDAAEDSYGDALFMHLYQAAGYKPNILFRSADTESILMMVAAEEGISILPDYCTDKLYHADNLVFVPLVGEGEEEEIIAAWQSGNANPALSRFLTALEEGFSGEGTVPRRRAALRTRGAPVIPPACLCRAENCGNVQENSLRASSAEAAFTDLPLRIYHSRTRRRMTLAICRTSSTTRSPTRAFRSTMV